MRHEHVKAAADLIRPDVDPHFAAKVPAESRLLHHFAEDVAKHLGLEPNVFNAGHVADLLRKHGVTAHLPVTYPKWVHALDEDGKPLKDKDGNEIASLLAHDEEEERAHQDAHAEKSGRKSRRASRPDKAAE
jgi:hypothetical protein